MRSPRDAVIITCAIAGNLTTPDWTPHLPITPEPIANSSLGARIATPNGACDIIGLGPAS